MNYPTYSPDIAQYVENELQRRGFKQENGARGHWRGNHPGGDSNGLRVTITPVGDGKYSIVYSDHAKGGEGGALKALSDTLGFSLPEIDTERKKTEVTKKPYRDLKEYAEAHGVDADIFETAQWKRTTYQNRPALEFPTKNGKRWRFLDGNKPYFISEAGYKACWYGLDKAIEKAERMGTPLIICNGEPSVVVAQFFGFPACAKTSGEARLPDNLLKEIKDRWKGDVLIALDCDKTGRKAAEEMLTQFADRAASIVDLGLTDGGDLADFCKLYDGDAFSQFWKIAPKPTKPGIETIIKTNLEDLTAGLGALSKAITTDERQRNAADVEKVIADVQATLDRVRNTAARPVIRTMSDAADEALLKLEQAYANKGKITGLSTGFTKLDRSIGGLREGTINIIYGATSMGKSSMISSIVRNILPTKTRGMIVPTETISFRYIYRLAASLCRIPVSKIDSGNLTPDEYNQVRKKIIEMKDCGWVFLEAARPSISQLRSFVLNNAATCQLVIIDSISNMVNAGDYTSVANVNNAIQGLALETRLPFLMTSQISRDVADRGRGKKRPQLNDASGGGVIENNADVVIGMYRHAYYVDLGLEEPDDSYPSDSAAGFILKNRDYGNVGGRLDFQFVGGAGFYERALDRI
jgi:replicative DNA helicase